TLNTLSLHDALPISLRQWSERWLADLEAAPDRSRATVVSYRSVLKNHVLPALGDIRLTELTTERVAEHLADLTRRPSRRHPGARSEEHTSELQSREK